MPSYEVLRIIWWLFLGVLLAGFVVMDGFDIGAAALHPFVARTDGERRVVLNSVGPVWEGNQVWFILGGGAIFAAWPILYAVSFSGFYLAMFLVLTTFIFRPVCFKYRSKLVDSRWRQAWDMILCFTGIVAPLVFGVAIGNVLQGVPFYFDETLRVFYTGSFWGLFSPFSLFCGVLSVVLFATQGAHYLTVKTQEGVQARAKSFIQTSALLLVVLFAIAGVWLYLAIPGYHLVQALDPAQPSNPLTKQVARALGDWFQNYAQHPWMWSAPLLAFSGTLLAAFLSAKRAFLGALVVNSIGIIGIVATIGFSMFPFLLPSSSNPSMSLTVWDASSSQLTLFIMLIATLIFLPIIIAYTTWVYRVMRGPVTEQFLKTRENSTY